MPAKLTFSDVLADVDRLECFASSRATLKTALRQTAWSIAFIEARVTGKHLDVDRKKLELARMPFDIAAINRLWEGLRYRMAGFTSEKAYRNARWGLRRICRALGMVVPHRAPPLPPDDPCAPLLAVATSFELATVRRFAAYLADQGLCPESVTNADLGRYADFLRTELVGVQIAPMLRRIVRLWRQAGANDPGWPRTALTPPDQPRPVNPAFSVYPRAVQDEIEAFRRWMIGTDGFGPFNPQRDRKPLRPDTVKLRLTCIRLLLGTHVALGHDPQSIISLRMLLSPPVAQAILQLIWERGQARLQTIPEDERDANANGNTGQLDAAGLTLLTLTHYFGLSPESRQPIQALVKRVRKTPTNMMSRRNQKRLDQFDDEVKLNQLLDLPPTMMSEAMALRASQPVEAARLARTAVMIAIELRVPLRIKNLHSCRLEHNLRFAGPGATEATLFYPASETKNHRDVIWSVNGRLCTMLTIYITPRRRSFRRREPPSPAGRSASAFPCRRPGW
jgi:hypothetical protein